MRRTFVRRWGRRLLVTLIILAALAAFAFSYIDKNIMPVVEAMAEARVRAMALKAINDAVREILKDPVEYTELVSIVQDETGKVAMVQSNAMALNEISTRTALSAQDKISQMGAQGIGIPIGSIIGSQLLSGRGPLIYVRIIPVGSVITVFHTEFENAGINQTRYRIIMNANTSVRIVMPGGGQKVEVSAEIPVAESIIIGDVPGSYVQVDDTSKLDVAQAVE